MSKVAKLAILAAMLFYIVVMLWLALRPADAHSWYPSNCCGDKDCYPVPCDQIHSEGDALIWHNMSIAKFKAQASPDGQCHVCATDFGIICIYLGGVS